MYMVTAEEMRGLDRYTIDTLGIPALTLMENAGRAVADEVLKLCAERSGKSNSGGFSVGTADLTRGIDRAEVLGSQWTEEVTHTGPGIYRDMAVLYGQRRGVKDDMAYGNENTGISS